MNDFAVVLGSTAPEVLEGVLKEVGEKSGVEFAVVSLPSAGGTPLSGIASSLFRDWGLGREGDGKGILLLIVEKEQMAHLEVGPPLQEVLPESVTSRLIGEVMLPRYRKRFFSLATEEGVAAVLQILNSRLGLGIPIKPLFGEEARHLHFWTPETGWSGDKPSTPPLWPVIAGKIVGGVLTLLLFLFLIFLCLRYPRFSLFFVYFLIALAGRRRGGGSAAGVKGFGGGLSGGGGAGRRW